MTPHHLFARRDFIRDHLRHTRTVPAFNGARELPQADSRRKIAWLASVEQRMTSYAGREQATDLQLH